MAILTTKISQIRNAVYGKDVRESIAGGIEAINTEVVNTTGRQDFVEKQFNGLIINAGKDNSQIVAAQTSEVTGQEFDTIGHRLDGNDTQLANKAQQEDVRLKAVKINATNDFDNETKEQMT